MRRTVPIQPYGMPVFATASGSATSDTTAFVEPPEGMTLAVVIDGAPATGEAGLVLEPSGQLPTFTLTFQLGEAAWLARGENGGRLRSLNPEEAARAG